MAKHGGNRAYGKGYHDGVRDTVAKIPPPPVVVQKQEPSFGYEIASSVANQVAVDVGAHVGNKIGEWLVGKMMSKIICPLCGCSVVYKIKTWLLCSACKHEWRQDA